MKVSAALAALALFAIQLAGAARVVITVTDWVTATVDTVQTPRPAPPRPKPTPPNPCVPIWNSVNERRIWRGVHPTTKKHWFSPTKGDIPAGGYNFQEGGVRILPKKTLSPDGKQWSTEVFRLIHWDTKDVIITTSLPERDRLVRDQGYHYHQVLGYVWKTPVCGALPWYRAYNPNTKDHLFTPHKNEFDGSVKVGWQDQGIVGYAHWEA